MAIKPGPISLERVDATSDDPKQARTFSYDLGQLVNDLLNYLQALAGMGIGNGLEDDGNGRLRVKVADNTIKRDSTGIFVDPSALGGVVPTGGIIPFGGAVAPSGFLLCDGAAVDRTVYADLLEVIGETFGAGDEETTFNVPDLRGRFPIGAGQGVGLTDRPITEQGGNETHTMTEAELKAHDHDLVTKGYFGSNEGSGSGWGKDVGPTVSNISKTTTSTGSTSAMDIMNPYLALAMIIRT